MSGLWLYSTSYVDLVLEVALIIRLLQTGLHRAYRLFFAYLTADATETLAGTLLQTNLQWYGYIYLGGQSLKMVLAVFMVLEIYRTALEGHPALSRFGQNTVRYVLAAAAAVATLAIALDRAVPPGRSPIIHHFNTFERTMDLWMLLFLAIIAVFMSWFPIRLRRNSVLYIGGFMVYFLSRSMGLLLRNLTPHLKRPIDNAMLTTSILCLLVWLCAFTPKGEKATTVVGHRWRPTEAERLAKQLDAINAKLLRLSRRRGTRNRY